MLFLSIWDVYNRVVERHQHTCVPVIYTKDERLLVLIHHTPSFYVTLKGRMSFGNGKFHPLSIQLVLTPLGSVDHIIMTHGKVVLTPLPADHHS